MSRVALRTLEDETPARGAGETFRASAIAASQSRWYQPEACPPWPLGTQPIRTYLEGLLENVPQILRGDGRAVIRAIGPETWRAYNESPVVLPLVEEAAEQVLEETAGMPAPRILEIGAGTAATTRAILARGISPERYVFTDVSSRFLEDARDGRSTPVPMQVTLLDLKGMPSRRERYHDQRDPRWDRWRVLREHEPFDVIVGVNALHVSPARETAQRLAGLLRPGGSLILGEGGAPYMPRGSWPLDMLFTCFPGWAGFLSAEEWHDLLEECYEQTYQREWFGKERRFGSVMVWRRRP